MKPLNIEHLMDNEVQTLSGGAPVRLPRVPGDRPAP